MMQPSIIIYKWPKIYLPNNIKLTPFRIHNDFFLLQKELKYLLKEHTIIKILQISIMSSIGIKIFIGKIY